MEESSLERMTREKKQIERMQVRIDELIRRIAVLENQLRIEKLHVRNEKTRFFRLEAFVKTYPKDQSYIAYLRDELRTAEQIIEKNQMTIEAYQKHYAKYGSFYTEWEEQVKKKGAEKDSAIIKDGTSSSQTE